MNSIDCFAMLIVAWIIISIQNNETKKKCVKLKIFYNFSLNLKQKKKNDSKCLRWSSKWQSYEFASIEKNHDSSELNENGAVAENAIGLSVINLNCD